MRKLVQGHTVTERCQRDLNLGGVTRPEGEVLSPEHRILELERIRTSGSHPCLATDLRVVLGSL